MAGKIEDAHVGTLKLRPELKQCRHEFVARDVMFFDDGEAETAQRFRHGLGIVHRVSQGTDSGFVAVIADDERDPGLFRSFGAPRWLNNKKDECPAKNENEMGEFLEVHNSG